MARQQGDTAYLIVGVFVGGLVSAMVAGNIKGMDAEYALALVVIGAVLGMVVTYGGVHWLRMLEAKEKALRERKFQMSLPPAPPTQIVGQYCVVCSTRIVFELDGSFCRVCHRSYCEKCKGRSWLCDDCG